MSEELDSLKNKIVATKQHINKIYEESLLPARQSLEKLMEEAAIMICPFKIGDTVNFENGKEGIVKKITYYSNNYFNPNLTQMALGMYGEKEENPDYSESVHMEFNQKNFSFTWQIEGVMKKADKTEGKRPFLPKNPFLNDIDEDTKVVSEKTIENSVFNSWSLSLDELFKEK